MTERATPRFLPETLRRQPARLRLLRWFFTRPEWLLRPLRTLRPILSLGGTVFVLRYDDVAEVLAQDDIFAVPFGTRITAVDRTGQNSILGMNADDPAYRPELARLMRAMPLRDLPRIGTAVRGFTEAALHRADSEIDIVGALFTPATTHIVATCFGVAASGLLPADIALWAMTLSTWIFATPYTARPLPGAVGLRQTALAAGAALGQAVDAAIAATDARCRRGDPPGETLVDRLVRDVLVTEPEASPLTVQNVVRPALDSLITAFVPNCTLAATNILGVLLDRPDIQASCRTVAQGGDDAALAAALMEAFRFRPLHPGPVRQCRHDYMLAADTPRARRIRAGTLVLACTQSAMFDARRVTRPWQFDPDRAPSDFMLFGYGPHACVGAALATTHLVNTFRPLLRGRRFARVAGARGRPAWFGAFPEHLSIRFST